MQAQKKGLESFCLRVALPHECRNTDSFTGNDAGAKAKKREMGLFGIVPMRKQNYQHLPKILQFPKHQQMQNFSTAGEYPLKEDRICKNTAAVARSFHQSLETGFVHRDVDQYPVE
ncbi:hypothetical protein Anapl_05002 [Anas platyrhynchos]|uniref:Uncharacterized protein n=1 Tax=Anas platyrhynchos TaxID=8839 RepID=R0LW40_ANAPL|nr:hypothetical protein Anapl_05002 [Anas platyrhynchos]